MPDEKPIGKIYAAIPAIMAEVKEIPKSRRNTQQNYAFRGIDDAYAAFQPLFARHGVFIVPNVMDCKREERTAKSGGTLIWTVLTIRHTFYASDGSSIDATTVGEAMDSGDKGSNKAESAALKYALLEVFCVPTEADNDTENQSPEVAPRQQAARHEVAAKMSKEDAQIAWDSILMAFDNHGIKAAEAMAIMKVVFVKAKVPNIVAGGKEFVDRVLSNIAKGSYDKAGKKGASNAIGK